MQEQSPIDQKQQQPREQALDLLKLLVSDWQPTAVQILWAIRIAVAVAIVLGVLALVGYSFDITLWDWLRVLAVPITIGAAVPWLNWLQKKREFDVENQRAEDEALQKYLDGMTELIVVRGLRGSRRKEDGQDKEDDEGTEDDEFVVRTVARARTRTVLSRLRGDLKRGVLQFLYEADLINKGRPVIRLYQVDLSGADLQEVRLRNADLSSSNLSKALLQRAYLRGANLRKAHLREADLSHAFLEKADMSGADLNGTNLAGASLRTSPDKRFQKDTFKNRINRLVESINIQADELEELDKQGRLRAKKGTGDPPEGGSSEPAMDEANLQRADLSGADLTGAYVSEEQLLSAKSLEGAIMPNGRTYEDWLKGKEIRSE